MDNTKLAINPSAPQQLSARWDAKSYSQFPHCRTRPIHELLSRVTIDSPRAIADLGCGAGYSTSIMARRWPQALLWGVDTSQDMLDTAKANYLSCHNIQWINADVTRWQPGKSLDLLFSNTLFHLIPHQQLLPDLLSLVKPGGCIALQMPDCFDEPWYQIILEMVSSSSEGKSRLAKPELHQHLSQRLVMDKSHYYNMLANHCSEVDIWDTEYLHVLDGDEPVYEWVSAAGLRPVLECLSEEETVDFLIQYREKLKRYYPKCHDGMTLFPFKRRFIVATLKEA